MHKSSLMDRARPFSPKEMIRRLCVGYSAINYGHSLAKDERTVRIARWDKVSLDRPDTAYGLCIPRTRRDFTPRTVTCRQGN